MTSVRVDTLARRIDRLESLRKTLPPETVVRGLDVTQPDAASILEQLLDELGGVETQSPVTSSGQAAVRRFS